MSNRSSSIPPDGAPLINGHPTLADFETATRVRYAGPNRGPGRTRAAGTVLEAHPHPDTPGALLVSVLWDDQDDARPYTATPDTLHRWTLLPRPRAPRPARPPR